MTGAAAARDLAAVTITLAHIRRYPVKGLSGEEMEAVELAAGRALPLDRRFALTPDMPHHDARRHPWLPKRNFVILMQTERLAQLESRLDAATGMLTISRGGKRVARGRLADPVGRAVIEEFFAAFLKGAGAGRPHLVEADAERPLSDSAEPVVSLVGLASVRDIERVAGGPVDPRRFRANLYLEGASAWDELGWVGREIAVGEARVRVIERIGRCAAINVNPATGARDVNLPKDLQRGFGHTDCGVYARVTTSGRIAVGDALTLL